MVHRNMNVTPFEDIPVKLLYMLCMPSGAVMQMTVNSPNKYYKSLISMSVWYSTNLLLYSILVLLSQFKQNGLLTGFSIM